MADFFKGLAGGFGTGLQFGQAIQDRQERERQLQMRDALAQEAGRYGVTEGAYGPGLQENIQQLQGLREQDPTQAPAYDQAIAELTRRQGLTAPDYSVASGPTNFATRQEARQAAAPLRAEGLAGVYRQYGDVTKADELEARAFEQQRAMAAEERAKTAEGRAAQDFATGQTERGLRINAATRTEAELKNISDAREALQKRRKEGPLTAAIISEVSGEFKVDPTKFLQAEDAVNTLEIKDLKRNLSTAALKGEDGLNKFLADKFDPDKTDNIKPMITKAKDGSFVVTYGDRVLQEYGAHKNMMSLVGGVINLIDQNPFDTLKTLSTLETQAAARKASEAQIEASKAQTEATGQKGLSKKVTAMEEILGRKLTEPEKLTLFTIAPKPREVSSEAVASLAKEMVNKPTGTMKDGKPEKHTVASAAAAARQALSAGPTADMQPVNSIIAAMQKNAAASQQRATPAGQQLVGLANTMLPPVAAPQPTPTPTTSAERLRQLSLGQPRQQ